MKYFLTTALVLFGTLAAAVPQAPRASGESVDFAADEIAKLINECGVRTSQMTGRLYSYTFHATDTDYTLDKHGRVKSEQSKLFEVYPINVANRRKWIYVPISENGVPLSAEKVASERERAARQTLELEKEAVAIHVSYKPRFASYGIKVEKHGGLSRTIWFINPTDFLVSHDFYAPQRVTLAGRETFLLHFRPRPGYVYDKTNVPYPEGIEDYGRAMSQLGGRIWIDALDKVIARLEANPAQELSSSSNINRDENAAVWFDFIRLSNGTWAPSVSRYNSYGREAVFWKTTLSRSRTYSDYRLFKTTAEVEKIEALPKQP